MKKFKILSLFILAMIGLNSCETEDDVVFVTQEPDEFVLTNTTLQEYILTPTTTNNLGERFTWNTADFGVPTNVSYDLQRSIMGDFSDAVLVGTTTSNEIAMTIGQMMAVAKEAGLDDDSETPASNMGSFAVRIRAYVGNGGSTEVISDTKTISVILQEAKVDPGVPELPQLFVVGNFLVAGNYFAEDWKAPGAVPIAASAFGKTDFEGFVDINVASPEYKFLPTNESFEGDYADDGTFTGVLVQEGEVNAKAAGPGYYLVKANTTTLKYSIQVTSWAITGNATPLGWPDNGVQDQNMTYNKDSKKWEIIIDLTAGDNEFKFRANDAWDLNFGDDEADGKLEYGGTNMKVSESGTYKVELDLSMPRAYTYTATLQ